MKPILAKDQVVLGPARCLWLALTGMSYRLFRSMVTVAILALAVAFLVHMLAYGYLAHRTQVTAYAELSRERLLGEWATRLSQPDQPAAVFAALAAADEARCAEYQRWSGISDAELAAAQRAAADLARADRELSRMAPSARAALLGDLTAAQVLARLENPETFQLFVDRMQSLRVQPPLESLEAFEDLVKQRRPALVKLAESIRRGQEQAIDQARRAMDGQSPRIVLAEPPPGLLGALRDAGYAIDADTMASLREQAQRAAQVAMLTEAMTGQDLRGALAREMDIDLSDVNLSAAFNWITSERRATWFRELLDTHRKAEGVSAEAIADLAQRHRRQQKLQAAVGAEVPQQLDGMLGLPSRTQWLIGLSFLVCVVGVANAMLMSVTERFAEIATMKCLGAMDRFVMMMFVFEATMQGLFGGLIGVVLGLVLALLRGLVEFGGLLFVPGQAWTQVGWSAIVSVACGVLLAGVAAVGPAWVAARLAPMEAMRVE